MRKWQKNLSQKQKPPKPMRNLNTTIVAISTPPGKGGVAVIRLSGEDAFAIADRVFLPRYGNAPLSQRPAREAVFGDILYDGEKIDDGLAVRFAHPHSFTGEDTVEVSCHGGVLVTRSVLEAFLSAGAMMAEGGEFTRRAFINGKITLTDAEAIGDLLEAKSLSAVRLAGGASRSKLTEALESIRYDLISLMSSIYARIDYPDEDLGEFTDEESLTILEDVRKKVEKLLSTYKTGRAIREGIRTVIVGKPNVGKSSLYNAILGEDYAIVTDIEGTTRDVLERTVPFGKVTLSLLDTAGLRKTDDPVEKIGVSRSRERMEEAELLLAVFDGSRPLDKEDYELIEMTKQLTCPIICIINKADMQTILDKNTLSAHFSNLIVLSAKEGDIEALREIIEHLFLCEELVIGEDAILSSSRQVGALLHVREFLDNAILAYRDGFYADCASSDIELAIGALGEIDGKRVSDEVVADIFSKFCVGK